MTLSIGTFGLGSSFLGVTGLNRRRRTDAMSLLMSGAPQAYPGQFAQLLADEYDKESQAVNKAKKT